MRDKPTAVAPPYMSGPTIQVECGHQRVVSFVTAAAAANAVLVWPDGNDVQSPDEKPLPRWKSSGSCPLVKNGRPRPTAPFNMNVTPSANSTASVPCNPRSATRSYPPILPTAYSDPPMTYAPGLAIASKPVDAFLRRRFVWLPGS